MINNRRQIFERGGLELANEAVHLLRTAPPRALACYAIGSCPFILALLYFWADMSSSAFAAERCFPAAFAMAVLFVWMKVWHTIYAAGLRRHIAGAPAERMTAREVLRLAAVQAILQPYGLVVLPIAFLLLMPFFPLYAFFQNLTVLGRGRFKDMSELVKKAADFSMRDHRQNHVLIWLLCPWVLAAGLITAFGSVRLAVSLSPELYDVRGPLWFAGALVFTFYFVLPICPLGCVVAGNIGLALIMIPGLLHVLLGVQSVFTLSGWHAIFNSTFLMTVFALSYLCLDPVIKAAYCLRCFYAEAETTGEDLIAEMEASR